MRSEGVRGENPEKADCVCLAVIVKHIHIQTLPQEPPWDQVPGTAQGYWEKMAAKKTEERELQKGPGASEHPALSTDFVSTPISCPPGLFPPTLVFCSEFSRTHTNLFWPSSHTFIPNYPSSTKSCDQGITNLSWPSKKGNPGCALSVILALTTKGVKGPPIWSLSQLLLPPLILDSFPFQGLIF